MATVGQALISPDVGYRRIDDSDSRIKYVGSRWKIINNVAYYNNMIHYTGIYGSNAVGELGEYVEFKLFSTKLRIISSISISSSTWSSDIKVNIDGVDVSTYTLVNRVGNSQVLVYEIIGLSNDIHTIRLTNNTDVQMNLDAIDIDDTGYLVHPILNQVSILENMQIGDCIPCRYTAADSGVAGYFSELGTCIANEIPIIGSATPNGLFYWIYVGRDYLGRKAFVADRVIQHSISWDTLNNAGITNEIPITTIGDTYISSIKLLTGGISATDKNNDWDKIILGSTLNNTITAGNNNVWNRTQVYSWTSTSTESTKRRIRGYTEATLSTITSSVANNIGFRPMLFTERINTVPTFLGQVSLNTTRVDDIRLTGTVNDGNENCQVGYKILLNNVQIYPVSGYTTLVTGPIGIDYVIANNKLTLGTNLVAIELINTLNMTNRTEYNVNLKNNSNPTGVLSLSKITVHSDNIIITGSLSDIDLDKISYRILLNNIEILNWSQFINDPYIDYTILNNQLTLGNNNLVIEYKDNFSESSLGSWEQTITKLNNNPISNLIVSSNALKGIISDADNDKIQYQIIINGKQRYPSKGYSEYVQTPYNINYPISEHYINYNNINAENNLTINIKDSFGEICTQNISFLTGYVGLMFMDESRTYLTTDIGKLLKYLDFGTIKAGDITNIQKVIIKNQCGSNINNLTILARNEYSTIKIEFSKTKKPFEKNDTLNFENIIMNEDEIDFYLRLSTVSSQELINGEMVILVQANQIN